MEQESAGEIAAAPEQVWEVIRATDPPGVTMGRLFFKRLTDRSLAIEAAGLKARCEGTR